MALNYIEIIAAAVRDALPPSQRPKERGGELYRLYALLVLTTGAETTLRDVHNAWSVWMSTDEPNHESLRPFEELDTQTREEDRPYLEAIQRVAATSR